jgi:hypothetical protein
MVRVVIAASGAILVLVSLPIPAQEPPRNVTPIQPGAILGRPSPPQPIQPQRLDYFAGSWTFSWTGRESPLTEGPRTGTAVYDRMGEAPFLELRVEGKSEAGSYKEAGVLGWHEGQKILALVERVMNGVEVVSIGDWTSPLSIRFESAPVRVRGQTLRLRRVYGIVSAQSFTVSEELSTDGGPFVRLGGGVFRKGG